MKVYENGQYSIISYICANRRNVDVVKGYKVLDGIPVWEDVEISIKLSHYDSRKTTEEEIKNAIEIAKIYINNHLTK